MNQLRLLSREEYSKELEDRNGTEEEFVAPFIFVDTRKKRGARHGPQPAKTLKRSILTAAFRTLSYKICNAEIIIQIISLAGWCSWLSRLLNIFKTCRRRSRDRASLWSILFFCFSLAYTASSFCPLGVLISLNFFGVVIMPSGGQEC